MVFWDGRWNSKCVAIYGLYETEGYVEVTLKFEYDHIKNIAE